MNRWIITAIAGGAIAILTAAPGCGATGVGDPCTPDEEYDPTFQGFSLSDVSVESKSYVCLTRLCLVNHFQGRVTCPYGQTGVFCCPGGVCPTPLTAATPAATLSTSTPPVWTCAGGLTPTAYQVPGAPGSPAADPSSQQLPSQYGCAIPGSVAVNGVIPPNQQITATNVSVAGSAAGVVPAQVTGEGAANRTANQAVYCSCRCANVSGNTDDGGNYCACPENYTCQQLVTQISDTDTGLTGGYCVLGGAAGSSNTTEYNPSLATNEVCSPTVTQSGQPGYCALQY